MKMARSPDPSVTKVVGPPMSPDQPRNPDQPRESWQPRAGTRRAPGPRSRRPAPQLAGSPADDATRPIVRPGTRPVPPASRPLQHPGTPPGTARQGVHPGLPPRSARPSRRPSGAGCGSGPTQGPVLRAAYLPATCLPVARHRRRTRIRPEYPPTPGRRHRRPCLSHCWSGAAVSIELGVFAKVHEAQPHFLRRGGFSDLRR